MVSERMTPGRRDNGAAAVEFALVVPILLVLVFGIIDYGLWFSDTFAAKDGVRGAARQGVVEDFGACNELRCLADETKSRIDSVSDSKAVHISVEASSGNPAGWKRGNNLVVCASVKSEGVTGLTPIPHGGLIRSQITMRIEQEDRPPADVATGYSTDLDPDGWSWCG